jgi:hypothetical protein
VFSVQDPGDRLREIFTIQRRTGMRNTSILLAGVALALAGAATPGFAHTHHRHMASSSLHHPSTPAERQQTAQLNQQQLAQAQNSTSTAVNNSGTNNTAAGSNVSSTASGTATQQNGLTTEPTSYQRMRGSSGASPNGMAPANTGTNGTATGAGDNAVGQDQQVGSPMNGNPQGNPSGAVSPPPPANPSGTPQ